MNGAIGVKSLHSNSGTLAVCRLKLNSTVTKLKGSGNGKY